MQYMEASDASGQELQDLDDELAAAAVEERYADAAGVKARMTVLSDRDVATGAMVQMDELLENERCTDSCYGPRSPCFLAHLVFRSPRLVC